MHHNQQRTNTSLFIVVLQVLLFIAVVAGSAAQAETLAVVKGWNLLSARVSVAPDTVFANGDSFLSVWKWDSGSWSVFLPGASTSEYADSKGFGVISTINPGEGFWLNSQVTKTLTVAGNAVYDDTLSLLPGWNLKGLTIPGEVNVTSCFADVQKIASVWQWLDGKWAVYLPGHPDGGAQYANDKGFQAAQAITAGEGFWVNSVLNGPGSVVTTPSGAGSFSPILYSSSGTPLKISWKYQINGGQPFSTNIEGINVNCAFNDFTLTIDPNTLKREGSFSGSLSGDASGSFTVNLVEDLMSSTGMSLVKGTAMNMDMSLSVFGESATISLDMMMDFDPPAEWFLDRSDLDQLPIGFVYDQQGAVYGTVSGSVSISGYGTSYIPSTSIASPETWTIIGQEPSVAVKGKTYNNVVKVKRTTVVPATDLSGGNQSLEVIYWVAKGIGMVKGVGYLQMLGQSLTVDLIETNLTQ